MHLYKYNRSYEILQRWKIYYLKVMCGYFPAVFMFCMQQVRIHRMEDLQQCVVIKQQVLN